MKIIILLIVLLWVAPQGTIAQHTYSLSGKLSDEKNQSLPDASVLLRSNGKGNTTEVEDEFEVRVP